MPFWLRHEKRDYELPEGETCVGRSASCDIALDDALVSRRHARFSVATDRVMVEDLGSRNGVTVNGRKIRARTRMKIGDRVTIGSHELSLDSVVAFGGETQADLPRLPRIEGDSASRASAPWQSESAVRRATAFETFAALAEKALIMGRAAEAERILASPLADVIESSRHGKVLTPALADQAAQFSARLASATGKGAWADYVIELYANQRRPCPSSVIDELNHALRRVSSIDLVRLRQYLAYLRSRSGSLGPAERFLVQRIEGLEKIAMLR